MKEIIGLTRVTIGGKRYTVEDLGKEKIKEIIYQRVEDAMKNMGYENAKNAEKQKTDKSEL